MFYLENTGAVTFSGQEMIVLKRRSAAKGFAVMTFGVGLFLAYCFPSKFIIITLAVMLVAAGVFIIKA